MYVKFIMIAVGVIAMITLNIFCPCPVPTPIAILYTATRLYFKKPKSESWGRWLNHLVIRA